jgi:methylated-DNA-[protein]-cysteine S-methyltransferase
MTTYTHLTPTPWGPVVLSARGDALSGLWFDGGRYQPDGSAWTRDPAHPAIRAAVDWLEAYAAGARPVYAGRLVFAGSPFREAVWRRLLAIPYGETTTYGQIAGELAGGSDGRASARAVGGAVGHNPISLIVPCHRVVGASGALVGYGGGLDRKKALLAFESAV